MSKHEKELIAIILSLAQLNNLHVDELDQTVEFSTGVSALDESCDLDLVVAISALRRVRHPLIRFRVLGAG